MTITPSILEEFKDRMHITHHSEDSSLERLLSLSYADLRETVGEFDISTHERGKELVFERSRYTYNDALEYFNGNFQTQINSVALSIAFKEGDSVEEV